ncbi:MAG: hypothetical protein QOI42_737, partial [Frankiaceae bacterium]|nr:hypothetical protein [Frankiaceae bacterium]
MQSGPGIVMPQPDAPARHDSLRRHNVGLVLRA